MICCVVDELFFDSIMVDMSYYEMDENLVKIRELVKYCYDWGIVIEVELGRIEGGEDGIVDIVDLEGVLIMEE